MKKSVITDVCVEVRPPLPRGCDIKTAMEERQRDCQHFLSFLQEHGEYRYSRGSAYNWDIQLVEKTEERCEFCLQPWETENGAPLCCEKAAEEFEKNATERDTAAAG